jgi:hypothetical protein
MPRARSRSAPCKRWACCGRFGAAMVAGLGMATKAAMDWESSWAGVTKTVSGTPAQLAKVEQGLRGLARTLPVDAR